MYRIENKKLFLPVSLSRSIYSHKFIRRILEWMIYGRADELEVVLFDEIEEINYRVFKGCSHADARRKAQMRAAELLKMFSKYTSDMSVWERPSVVCVSQREFLAIERFGQRLKYYSEEIHRAYQFEKNFREDVQSQVRQNLFKREEILGREFIDRNIESLSGYILSEIAFFEAYRVIYPDVIEIYPGKNLFVKENIWNGKYFILDEFSDPTQCSKYVDISFLAETVCSDLPNSSGSACVERGGEVFGQNFSY